jgi:hypothetical protein
MKRFLFCFFIIQFCSSAVFYSELYSQDFIDLLNMGTKYMPVNHYDSGSGSFKYTNNYFTLQYPRILKNKNKDVLLAKLSLNQYNINDSNSMSLFIFYLQLGMQKNFSERTSLRFAVAPKIASELKDIDKKDFLMPVTAVMQFKKSDKFTYGFGLFYSKEFFGHFLFPVIHAKWKISNAWFFYADFPIYGYLMYYPKKVFKAGIYASTSTNSIRLSEEHNSNYIQKSYADFSLFFDLYFNKNIVLRAEGGYSMMRSLAMYKKDDTVPFTFSVVSFDDHRTQLNRDIDNAFFVKASLIYRYHY